MLACQQDTLDVLSTERFCVQPQRRCKFAHSLQSPWHISAVGASLNVVACTRLPASRIGGRFPPAHIGLELHVTPVWKSRRLPGSSGMLTQLPPSACFHSQMGTSLSWARQHMFTPPSSPTCWRKVTGNVRRVVTSVQNFRDKHVDGICDGFVPPLLRNGGMSGFSPAVQKFITHRLQRRPRNGSRNSYWSGGTGWVAGRLSKAWLGAEAPSMCQVYRNGALKTQAPMSQPKALDSESPNAVSALPRRWEQIGTTSGSHFTPSPLQGEEERNLWGRRRGGGSGRACVQIFSAMQSRKKAESSYTWKRSKLLIRLRTRSRALFWWPCSFKINGLGCSPLQAKCSRKPRRRAAQSRFPVPLSHKWLHRDCQCYDDWRPFCFSFFSSLDAEL